MTRTEHLLFILAEECAEVAQRAAKAARFGLDEIQPGQTLTNAARIKVEMVDLIAVWGLLCRQGSTLPIAPMDQQSVEQKQAKVEDFLAYSDECGTLQRG